MEEKTVLTLDDGKEYVIVSDLEYEGKKYLYLANIKEFTDALIVLLEEDIVIDVTDEKLLSRLTPFFAKKVSENLK